MRLAVFSDIHSNHHALKACLKEAEKQKSREESSHREEDI